MKFSTRTRYALRLMIELASSPEDVFISLKDIAQKQDISIKYLEQIAMHLTRSGLIVSSRGSQGGYKLTRTPSQYTPGEIIRAIAGNITPVACMGHHSHPCQRQETCKVFNFWLGLQKNMDSYLDSMTLEDLVS